MRRELSFSWEELTEDLLSSYHQVSEADSFNHFQNQMLPKTPEDTNLKI